MKPEQFIREQGLDKAREVVEGIPSKYMECYYSTLCYCTKAKKYSDRFNPRIELVNMADLKRLVESLDRINKCGGLYGFKTYCNGDYSQEDLQAIRDHESIYGGGHV
ncbi:hypothetical protein DOL91_10255 [Acinetobacter baumannii]|uniref:hypothetical protein n=1 Tax=Acinetobacter baumannii TaxID=470 RepID=UPI000DA7B531|nr:hypothetical protein [Acinetobacter baumannii]PZL91269.1 hypothetical protein DOL91_10255 [Acinetobacter baumannii]